MESHVVAGQSRPTSLPLRWRASGACLELTLLRNARPQRMEIAQITELDPSSSTTLLAVFDANRPTPSPLSRWT
jgi:hypothetical protein